MNTQLVEFAHPDFETKVLGPYADCGVILGRNILIMVRVEEEDTKTTTLARLEPDQEAWRIVDGIEDGPLYTVVRFYSKSSTAQEPTP